MFFFNRILFRNRVGGGPAIKVIIDSFCSGCNDEPDKKIRRRLMIITPPPPYNKK